MSHDKGKCDLYPCEGWWQEFNYSLHNSELNMLQMWLSCKNAPFCPFYRLKLSCYKCDRMSYQKLASITFVTESVTNELEKCYECDHIRNTCDECDHIRNACYECDPLRMWSYRALLSVFRKASLHIRAIWPGSILLAIQNETFFHNIRKITNRTLQR